MSKNPKEEAKKYTPLGGVVNEKPYADAGTTIPPDLVNLDIPEQVITSKPIISEEIPTGDNVKSSSGGSSSSGQPAKKKEEPKQDSFNQELNDLPDGEKKEKAEQLAKYLLQLYASGKLKANDLIKISDRKIAKAVNAGEIDTDLVVHVGENQKMSLGEFFAFYNEQCEGKFTMSQEFYDAVLPVLTRVLAKRGHGMTDEQFLAFMFGQDIFMMVQEGFAMRSTLNEMMRFAKETTANKTSYQAPKPPAFTPPPATPAPSNTYYAPEVEVTVGNPNVEAVAEANLTLQERAILASGFTPAGSKSSGAPVYGDKKKLKNLEKFADQSEKAVERASKNAKNIIKRNAGNKIVIPDAVPTGGKRRGRKPGTKNKPKK